MTIAAILAALAALGVGTGAIALQRSKRKARGVKPGAASASVASSGAAGAASTGGSGGGANIPSVPTAPTAAPNAVNATQGNSYDFGRFASAVTASGTASREGIDNTPGPTELHAAYMTYRNVIAPLDAATGGRVRVTSWYRSPTLNSRVGGENGSQHVRGEAVDFYIDGMDRNDAWRLLRELAANGQVAIDQAILYHRNATGPNIHVSHTVRRVNRNKYTFRTSGGSYVDWTGQVA